MADIGYAVADAEPEARTAADRITVRCVEHAIAHIISDIELLVEGSK
jgi:hydroxymethylpyrimidine pyrophosphatase-like HAD family hydrolase